MLKKVLATACQLNPTLVGLQVQAGHTEERHFWSIQSRGEKVQYPVPKQQLDVIQVMHYLA